MSGTIEVVTVALFDGDRKAGHYTVATSEADAVLEEIKIFLSDATPGDQLRIRRGRISRNRYESMPEFQGF